MFVFCFGFCVCWQVDKEWSDLEAPVAKPSKASATPDELSAVVFVLLCSMTFRLCVRLVLEFGLDVFRSDMPSFGCCHA